MAEARAILSLRGYDNEFLSEVDDELQCAICQLPLKDPMLNKCGHRFLSLFENQVVVTDSEKP